MNTSDAAASPHTQDARSYFVEVVTTWNHRARSISVHAIRAPAPSPSRVRGLLVGSVGRRVGRFVFRSVSCQLVGRSIVESAGRPIHGHFETLLR